MLSMLVNRGSCLHVNFFFEIDTQTPGTQFLMGLRFEKKSYYFIVRALLFYVVPYLLPIVARKGALFNFIDCVISFFIYFTFE